MCTSTCVFLKEVDLRNIDGGKERVRLGRDGHCRIMANGSISSSYSCELRMRLYNNYLLNT